MHSPARERDGETEREEDQLQEVGGQQQDEVADAGAEDFSNTDFLCTLSGNISRKPKEAKT